MTRNMTPARPLSVLRGIARPIIDAMPDKATATFPDKFSELLSLDIMTPSEIAIVLDKRIEYGRVHLARMRKRMNREWCQDKLGIYPPGFRGD